MKSYRSAFGVLAIIAAAILVSNSAFATSKTRSKSKVYKVQTDSNTYLAMGNGHGGSLTSGFNVDSEGNVKGYGTRVWSQKVLLIGGINVTRAKIHGLKQRNVSKQTPEVAAIAKDLKDTGVGSQSFVVTDTGILDIIRNERIAEEARQGILRPIQDRKVFTPIVFDHSASYTETAGIPHIHNWELP